MVGEWIEKSLGELIEIKHGFAFKGAFIRDEPAGDILLTPGNFAIGGGFKGDKLKYYDGPVPEEFVLKAGELIVTMTDLSKQADTLGYPALVPPSRDGRRFLHNQRLGKVIPRENGVFDFRYLYYLMHCSEYRHEIIAGATGTTVKHTSPERIKRFRLMLPTLHEQRAIAHVLGTLDDKIDLNRRTNETLEAMARTLFKSWFVDFDPVRAKAKGRAANPPEPLLDLFPNALDEFENPVGWKMVPLLSEASLISGGTPKTEIAEYWNGNIAWATAKDVSQCSSLFLVDTERTITDRGLAESSTRIIPQFSTVVVARGATTGRFCLLGRDMAMNQTCYALHSKRDRPCWLTLAFSEIVRSLVHAAHGSVFDTITTRTIEGGYVILAPDPVMQTFEKVVRPFFHAALAHAQQNMILTALRDTLLPKLISGEIRVPVAERLAARYA